MLKLTIPIIIQNLLSAAVNSADVIMLNYVGQSAISAVSLAANYSNILFMVYYGLGTGASLLCAQYFGKNNMQAIHAIEGIALRFSIIISGIVALIAFTAPQLMMKIFTSDQELISIGSSYLRIMGIPKSSIRIRNPPWHLFSAHCRSGLPFRISDLPADFPMIH